MGPAPGVFREGAENGTRGGRAPISIADFGLKAEAGEKRFARMPAPQGIGPKSDRNRSGGESDFPSGGRHCGGEPMHSRFPFLDLFNVFIGGNGVDRGHKINGVRFLFDLPAQGAGQGVEPGGGDLGEVALFEFGLHAREFFSEHGDAGLDAAQDAIPQFVHNEGALVGGVEAELAAPLDERAFGDAEFRGDADEGPALGAVFDELLLGFR